MIAPQVRRLCAAVPFWRFWAGRRSSRRRGDSDKLQFTVICDYKLYKYGHPLQPRVKHHHLQQSEGPLEGTLPLPLRNLTAEK